MHLNNIKVKNKSICQFPRGISAGQQFACLYLFYWHLIYFPPNYKEAMTLFCCVLVLSVSRQTRPPWVVTSRPCFSLLLSFQDQWRGRPPPGDIVLRGNQPEGRGRRHVGVSLAVSERGGRQPDTVRASSSQMTFPESTKDVSAGPSWPTSQAEELWKSLESSLKVILEILNSLTNNISPKHCRDKH